LALKLEEGVGKFLAEEFGFDVFVVSAFGPGIFCIEASWSWRGLRWWDKAEGL
jgi:hypothetical protein